MKRHHQGHEVTKGFQPWRRRVSQRAFFVSSPLCGPLGVSIQSPFNKEKQRYRGTTKDTRSRRGFLLLLFDQEVRHCVICRGPNQTRLPAVAFMAKAGFNTLPLGS
jgi:hypothetical protein